MAKAITLKNIPPELSKTIDAKQKEEEKKCDGCTVSKDRAIFKIIREWKELRTGAQNAH